MPSSVTTIRLKPSPRIVGFDCPEPILIALTPGIPLSDCMRLPVKFVCKYDLSMRTVLTEDDICVSF